MDDQTNEPAAVEPKMDTQTYLDNAAKTARGVDRTTLANLVDILGNGKKTVLLGFNDYAKHLINICPNICGVVDSRYSGVSFRGVIVSDNLPECEQAVVVDYSQLFAFKQRHYAALYKRKAAFRYPAKFGEQETKTIDFISQDPLYQHVFNCDGGPPTMMSRSGIFFILEMLRSCLRVPGAIAEVGAWQGGSAFYMARLLAHLGSDKDLLVFEKGEALKGPNGVVCEEQMRRDLAFYAKTQCLFGPALSNLQAMPDVTFAFVFLDFGFSGRILEFLYDRLSVGGMILFDNYGHTQGHPDLFDAFFERRGESLVRLPRSTSAFMVKRVRTASRGTGDHSTGELGSDGLGLDGAQA
jgi:hypothetical protein